MPKRSSRRRRGSGKRARRPFRKLLLTLSLGAVALGAGYVAWLDSAVRSDFDGKRWAVPARIYARPLELYAGKRLTEPALREELAASGYRRVSEVTRPGTYAQSGARFDIQTREFSYWDATEPAHRVRVELSGGEVGALTEGGRELALFRIDPALIGRILPEHREDRVLVRLEDLPPYLAPGVIAVEDRDFHHHRGVSIRGIARAAWQNLRAGETVQGGSTLTQQLAKNFFLTPERTLVRKLNEASIALLLEARYDKRDILEAYLNEVFLGQDGNRAVHGFGSAAEFYFARPAAEMDLAETALLIALVRGASYYDPRRHPQRALERRNLVLSLLVERGVVGEASAERAAAQPLGVTEKPSLRRYAYPAFVDLVRRQLRRDYRNEDLRSEGLRVFTTLAPSVQAATESALREGIGSLEGRAAGKLQGAVVVTSVHNGEVLALAGDRDPKAHGFNRALDALRPVGSIIKPAVYLTALARSDDYSLLTRIDDSPLRVELDNGQAWAPKNYDRRSHGTVPLLEALTQSYNQATVRLGMQVGVSRVLRTLAELGIERRLPAYPSLLLGAVSLTPIEVAALYQSLASGGFEMPLRAIREITDSRGRRLSRYGLSVHEAFEPGPVFLVNTALTEVMRTGTGQGVRARISPEVVLAGKTGTTDELRDSWFAGFDRDRLAVVWLGRDDNADAGLTGASGALQVWTRLMAALAPTSLELAPPAGVELHWADLRAGTLTGADCPGARALPFMRGHLPAFRDCAKREDSARFTAEVPSAPAEKGRR